MENFPYLVSLALIEQDGNRLMPLGGKSLKTTITSIEEIKTEAESISLELLTRILERTKDGSIKRANADQSLLLIEIPLEVMQKQLPLLKSDWIKTGNSGLFIEQISNHCNKIWTLNFVRYEGISFNVI